MGEILSENTFDNLYEEFFGPEESSDGVSDSQTPEEDFLSIEEPETTVDPNDPGTQELLDIIGQRMEGSTLILDVPTPTSRQIEASLKRAFVQGGGDLYFLRLMSANPGKFADLMARVLPKEPTEEPTDRVINISVENYADPETDAPPKDKIENVEYADFTESVQNSDKLTD